MPTPFRFDPNLLRDLLNGRLHELRAEVHAAHLARQAPDAPDPREVGDRKDEAARHQLDDLGDAQERRDLDELASVVAALQRLDAGTYGGCTDCGEPIPAERLQVQPAASRCAACQAAHEGAALR
ncbi:MAG: TraR/DksA family transcriptional regulator [Pseudomonadota bacterium]